MRSKFVSITLAAAFVSLAIGCAPTMKKESGFLGDYSKLEKVNDDLSRWKDPSFTKGTCDRMIFDPIIFNVDEEVVAKFTDEEQREIREYAQEKFTEVLTKRHEIVTYAGPGICRLRLALTDLEKSVALANIHPLTRATGAGRGGAAIEAEVTDSETGKVIGMGTRRATGEFFEGTGMGDLADIKSAIDRWIVDLDERFDRYWWGS